MTNEELYDLCHRTFDVDYEVGILTWKDIPEVHPKVRNKEAGWHSPSNSYVSRRMLLRGVYYKYHRILYLMYHGTLPTFLDHKDGNPLNNSIHNLRPATKSQNGYNCRARSNRKYDLPKGIYTSGYKYRARITVNKVTMYLGTYDTPEEAQQAYIEAAKKYHGDFARFD